MKRTLCLLFALLLCGSALGEFMQFDSFMDNTVEYETMPAVSEAASLSYSEQSSIACGSDPNLLNNISLCAGSISDTLLESGDLFSFNSIVGPRDSAYGYLPALNGRGVEVVGGGVAQVASAIWLAIRNRSDFAIVSKTTYGGNYNQSYVQSSADAILTDYNADIDFSFRYTGSGYVTINTYLTGTTLTCEIVTVA